MKKIYRERISEEGEARAMIHRIAAAFNEVATDQRVFWEWLKSIPGNGLIKDLSLCEAAQLAEDAAGVVYIEDMEKEAEENAAF